MPGIEKKPEIAGAICAPPAEGAPQVQNVVQPRQPSTLQGLLRYAMQSDPQDSENQPMDEERKRFLEEALKSMTVDVIGVLQKQINTLQKVETVKAEDDITEYDEALETIFDYIDDIDIANDFHKIGGFTILYPCLKCSHPKIRAGACELIAVLCQNNPYCQQVVLDNEFMPKLLNMLEKDENIHVAIKALYALSAIVRDCQEGFNQLIHYNGLTVLRQCLQRNDDKLVTKTTFLLAVLCQTQPDLKSRLIYLDYIPSLIFLISSERRPSHEHILSLLLKLVEENSTAVIECKSAKYNLKEVLEKYIQNVRNKEECLEEEQYCKRLLHLIST